MKPRNHQGRAACGEHLRYRCKKLTSKLDCRAKYLW